MKFSYLLSFMLLIGTGLSALAQCGSGEDQIVIRIVTDAYPTEISWTLSSDEGTLFASGGSYADQNAEYLDTVCVSTATCLSFQILDGYGDGIFAPGGYWLYINGQLWSNGNSYGHGTSVHANCPEGSFCSSAFPLNEFGQYTADLDNTWYVLHPDSTGSYEFSTCSLNTCDTRIYLYDNCNSDHTDEGPPGTYAYNDDADACAPQSNLEVMLIAGNTYYLRIGDGNNDCTGPVVFTYNYLGPVQGCMDINACNFNPLAAVSDGSCVYYPSPMCQGPDLLFDSLAFVNSLYLLTHTTTTCDVEEGCVLGYGTRYCLAFSSKIDNQGTTDFYIGTPASNPQMFNTQNCHGHTHFTAYGDYRLYDMDGNIIPAGHKNGFCVMDLCGFGQYNCGNMGISAGCYDVYGAGTQCQWIDITDIPTGDYKLVVIVNPYHIADALGRYETNFNNNASWVCIHIEHNEGGAPTWQMLGQCPVYTDCLGVQGGSAVTDCNGNCNGNALWGDIYNDQAIDSQDSQTYVTMLTTQNAPVSPCTDLSGDGTLTVYDAALMQWCHHSAPVMGPDGTLHQNCAFPRDVVNEQEMTGLAISGYDLEAGYLDIELNAPMADVVGYQFGISGAVVSGIQSLVNATDFPVVTDYNTFTNQVIALSPADSVIHRANAAHNIVRVFFNQITSTTICIDPIVDIVNKRGERTFSYVYGNCISTLGVNALANEVDAHLLVVPNPVSQSASIRLVGNGGLTKVLLVRDQLGREVKRINANNLSSDAGVQMDVSDLKSGVYFISAVQNDKVVLTERFVKL
jgi:hypothetical protein